MMDTTAITWITCFITSVALIGSVNIIPDYYMQNGVLGHCGHTISDASSAFVRSHVGAYQMAGLVKYQTNVSCVVGYDAGNGKQVLIKFMEFDVEDTVGGLCADEFSVYDTASFTSPVSTLCGSQEISPIESTGRNVSLEFTTDESITDNGFKILVTSFRYEADNCTSGEFKCDLHRCIAERLTCDGTRHCVDGTDEDSIIASCSTLDIILGHLFKLGEHTVLAIGILAGAVVFTTFVGVFIYLHLYKRDNKIHPTDDAVLTTGSNATTGNGNDLPPKQPSKAWEANKRTKKKNTSDLW